MKNFRSVLSFRFCEADDAWPDNPGAANRVRLNSLRYYFLRILRHDC
jgi:hypothetical protein